ncbi:unnamed protein product [Owenia fusiformis]|uniref:omega-amidase n=1 Tax=Owenia fusiformis TaxID=6347 RepID=A0A8J1TVG1_OWEFU|nr:unnamed protein product [Owenia fusiformis]
MSKTLRLGLIQLAVGSQKLVNVKNAIQKVKEAVDQGAKLIALPECFNCPYGTQYFADYAETIPGPTTDALATVAKEHNVYIVGGSIPETANGKIYNTCAIFGPCGSIIAKHRKMHLFDIDVPGKIRFQESEVLTGGNNFTTFDMGACKVGIGICYDIRFPEMAQIYADKGCSLLLYPGAFNMTTGPAHWELLQRARAVDNQLFVATVSPARDTGATYVAWGHSTAINPWGEILAKASHEETNLYVDIDLTKLQEVRDSIPVKTQKRSELYSQTKDLTN